MVYSTIAPPPPTNHQPPPNNKQDRILSKGAMHRPPSRCFLYLRETKSWRCEEGEEEKVHLLTHTTARAPG